MYPYLITTFILVFIKFLLDWKKSVAKKTRSKDYLEPEFAELKPIKTDLKIVKKICEKCSSTLFAVRLIDSEKLPLAKKKKG